MKTIHIVTSCGYRPAVAFESKERAEAVRAMCGGSVDEVQVIDAPPSMIDYLDAIGKTSKCVDGGDGDGDGDEAE